MSGTVFRAGTDADLSGRVLPSLSDADAFLLSARSSLIVKAFQRINEGTVAGTACVAGIREGVK